MKRIAVLTSGGDAPGMNACLRAVVRSAIYHGMEVYGVERGYAGLINDELKKLEMRSVSNIVQLGGTKLRSARCLEMLTPEGKEKAVATLKKHDIEGLIVIGGDGSFRGARALAEDYGVPTVGIPATIDNDFAYTDFAIGFDTAVNTCLDIINKLRDTMTSHERSSVVEVMGRHCGDIALYSGIASGAEVIVLPEVPMTIEEVVEKVNYSHKQGKYSNIIILAEGVMHAEEFTAELQKHVPYEIRSICLGHVQRGGSPTMQDRMLAAQFGVYAVKLLLEGKSNRAIGIHDNKLFDMDIIEAVSKKRVFNKELYETMQMISM